MKAPPFRYARPARIDEVFELLERHGDGARVLAGGQSLLATLNLRLSAPELLVDIGALPLGGIRETVGTIEIGALVTHREVERSALVARHLPLVTAAMPHVAHVAIRNRGTVGGSLALADPAAEWPALAVALGARITLQRRAGQRVVPAEQFFKGLYETALEPGELVTSVAFDKPPPGQRHHFAELARRHGDYAAAGIAAVADAPLRSLRCVLFGVGVTPLLLHAAGHGRDAIGAQLHAALAERLDPPGDLHFSAEAKRRLATVLAGRALAALFAH